MTQMLHSESIYRRGARRWRKLYYASGHAFQAKRFNRVQKMLFLLFLAPITLHNLSQFYVRDFSCFVWFNVPVPFVLYSVLIVPSAQIVSGAWAGRDTSA